MMLERTLYGRNSENDNPRMPMENFKKYSRIVSIECIEHCRTYNLLFRKLRSILKDDGFCFFQILGHREYSYGGNLRFAPSAHLPTTSAIPSQPSLSFSERGVVGGRQPPTSWMGRHFFTGGTIPSMHLFTHFNDDLVVSDIKVINGKQYSKSFDVWLKQMYQNKTKIMDIFKTAYGKDAAKMYQGWRMFYLMCSESFGYRDGNEWCVGYITMRPR